MLKSAGKGFFFILVLLALTASVFAQSPREELQQMIEQLQMIPNDNALREQIIKLALTLNPLPALPSEAERRMVRGSAAFKGATSSTDYQEAAKEFEQATLAAPWYGDAYFNLGVSQDKAENYEDALRSLKLARLASPDSKEIQTLIYEVEYRQEKSSSPEVRAAKQKIKDESLMKNLEGAVFTMMSDPEFEKQYRISNGRVVYWTRTINSYRCPCGDRNRCDGTFPTSKEEMCNFSVPLEGRRAEYRVTDGWSMTLEISTDGQTLLMREIDQPGSIPRDYVYKRR